MDRDSLRNPRLFGAQRGSGGVLLDGVLLAQPDLAVPAVQSAASTPQTRSKATALFVVFQCKAMLIWQREQREVGRMGEKESAREGKRKRKRKREKATK